jgi:hypothetical protein
MSGKSDHVAAANTKNAAADKHNLQCAGMHDKTHAHANGAEKRSVGSVLIRCSRRQRSSTASIAI